MTPRRRALLVALGGAIIAVLVPVVWSGTHADSQSDPAAARSIATTTASAAPTGATTSSPAATLGGYDGAIDAQPATAEVPPVSVVVPSLSLTAPVVPVGVDTDQQMQIPTDISTVGWYRYGPSPGDPLGSAVIAGHVDDAVQGLGVFSTLRKLDAGATLSVLLADGRSVAYQVVSREVIAKTAVPWARFFDRTGAPRLVLITCGGAFDQASRSYEDNVLVTAVPVP